MQLLAGVARLEHLLAAHAEAGIEYRLPRNPAPTRRSHDA
jgi:hypothetical protein